VSQSTERGSRCGAGNTIAGFRLQCQPQRGSGAGGRNPAKFPGDLGQPIHTGLNSPFTQVSGPFTTAVQATYRGSSPKVRVPLAGQHSHRADEQAGLQRCTARWLLERGGYRSAAQRASIGPRCEAFQDEQFLAVQSSRRTQSNGPRQPGGHQAPSSPTAAGPFTADGTRGKIVAVTLQGTPPACCAARRTGRATRRTIRLCRRGRGTADWTMAAVTPGEHRY